MLWGWRLIDFVVLVAIIVGIAAAIIARKIKGKREYGRLDKAGIILNVVISFLCFPLTAFVSIFAMSVFSISNQTAALLNDIGGALSFLAPLVCIASIIASVILRAFGKSKWSFGIQFLPIAMYVVAFILWAIAAPSITRYFDW